jgi:hypothetical protein
MLNPIEFYSDLGRKAGIARNQRDEARAQSHADHFRRAKALEVDDDKVTADEAYRQAYREVRAI